MSVVDLSGVDPRTLIDKGRVGLLDSTGSYDVDRYAWAYEFWKRQQQTHWMGEEVPLGQGQVNIKAFVKALQKVGYRGALCIEREVGNQEERLRDVGHGIRYLRECLAG